MMAVRDKIRETDEMGIKEELVLHLNSLYFLSKKWG